MTQLIAATGMISTTKLIWVDGLIFRLFTIQGGSICSIRCHSTITAGHFLAKNTECANNANFEENQTNGSVEKKIIIFLFNRNNRIKSVFF